MEDNYCAPRIGPAGAAAISEGEIESAADHVLDITAEICPMTFVRTRLALDKAAPGESLLVKLRGDEPRQRVPATVISLGHEVVRIDDLADGTSRLLIRRN